MRRALARLFELMAERSLAAAQHRAGIARKVYGVGSRQAHLADLAVVKASTNLSIARQVRR